MAIDFGLLQTKWKVVSLQFRGRVYKEGFNCSELFSDVKSLLSVFTHNSECVMCSVKHAWHVDSEIKGTMKEETINAEYYYYQDFEGSGF